MTGCQEGVAFWKDEGFIGGKVIPGEAAEHAPAFHPSAAILPNLFSCLIHSTGVIPADHCWPYTSTDAAASTCSQFRTSALVHSTNPWPAVFHGSTCPDSRSVPTHFWHCE